MFKGISSFIDEENWFWRFTRRYFIDPYKWCGKHFSFWNQVRKCITGNPFETWSNCCNNGGVRLNKKTEEIKRDLEIQNRRGKGYFIGTENSQVGFPS